MLALPVVQVYAQEPAAPDRPAGADTIIRPADEKLPVRQSDTLTRQERITINSNKALLYSAIIPGGGQIYNRKYWKLPIVYGGFVALGIAINFNQRYYNEFQRELNYRNDGDPITEPKYDPEQIPNTRIIEARDYYRRYRDITILGVIAMYGLSVVDAYIDAELSNFDISEDLSLQMQPVITPGSILASRNKAYAGISLTFSFK